MGWLLILLLHTANPVADITQVAQIGPFKTYETCVATLERAKNEFGSERGVTVRGFCVLQ